MAAPTPYLEPVIDTFGLTKRYPGAKHYALKRLSLTINRGEVYGFLGPNGAGKTTAARLLMNFIQPTVGQATILGMDAVLDAVAIKAQVGYLTGEIALYPRLNGRQFLSYMSQLQEPKRPAYARELIQRFKAELNQPIKTLSKGNRQKLAVIQAFMHEPAVLILDEPTSGLDPLMQEVFFELVKEFKARGATLFISSHDLTEVQKMCDRVGFIRAGELIREQSLADLANQATQTFDIGFADAAPLAELRQLARTKVTSNSQTHVTVALRGDLSRLFAILARHQVTSLNQREVNLEDEFMSFYRHGAKK